MRDLYTFIAGPKCHAEFFGNDDIVERTETGLGGFFADPPAMVGRSPDGGRLWSREAVRREVVHALALQSDPFVLRPLAPWDEPGKLPAPAVRRLQVTTPEVARTLPESFRRPGTHYLEGVESLLRRGLQPSVVAFDPGGAYLDPLSVQWYTRNTGEPIRVTTDPEDIDAVLLDTLDSRAIDWATKRPLTAIASVTVDPLRVRTVGAVSGVIDASLDGLADPGAYRTIYEEMDKAAVVRAEAARLGKGEFRRRTRLSEGVAQRAASGRTISRRNVEIALRRLQGEIVVRLCAFEGCHQPVPAATGRFCSKAHRDRAYRARRRQNPTEDAPASRSIPMDGTPQHPTCAHCDTLLLGLAAVRGTCSTHSEGA